MPRVLKRPKAENDLDEIWWYIAQDNPQNADQFLDRIQEKLLALAAFPKMGVRRADLQAGLRCLPIGNYLIFYCPVADGIDVVRVLHGHMDIERHWSESEN
jgi:toxin ParE1/3/4